MTNAERIREMTDEELAKLLVWRHTGLLASVPSCDEGCEFFEGGCAKDCPHERREKAVREWLKEEYR